MKTKGTTGTGRTADWLCLAGGLQKVTGHVPADAGGEAGLFALSTINTAGFGLLNGRFQVSICVSTRGQE